MDNKKKYTCFDELKESCKRFVESSKERGAYSGLKKLLTELYPDKAHFIYELLQNAEDQEASEVEFCLEKEKLIFKHNGKKRDFTLEDIDSITNIGNSTKRDDLTTIGKFGVGFKAVYAYTDTPEIHSGEYDFKIIDMLIPDDNDVEKRAKKGVTEFVFPFDNANKPADKAVSEIAGTLKSLDETAILFLNNIKRISFVLPNQEYGKISIISNLTDKKFIFAIDRQTNDIVTRTWWSKFFAKCPIIVDGETNHYTVSIAYKMIKVEEKFSVDSSLIGKVCIYFPTDQKSLLHFHINAPFASTVARDNIQYCQENEMLLGTLSDLMIASLYDFRKSKMLDYSVYEALPNQRDPFDNSSRYRIFLDEIIKEFSSSALFIDEDGEYKKKEEIYLASNDVKRILSNSNVKKLYSKSWIPTFQPTRRIEYFLNQFKINEYKMDKFLYSLKEDYRFFDEVFQSIDNVDYYRHLYYMLSQVKDVSAAWAAYNYNVNEELNKKIILNNVRCFLCEDGCLHSISENLFLRTDYNPVYTKNPLYINFGKGNKDRINEIKTFLISIGVMEMTLQTDTKFELDSYSDSDDVVVKLLEIIQYLKENKDIDVYKDSKFILAKRIDDGQLCKVTAKEACWSYDVVFFYKDDDIVKYVVANECYQSLDSSEWDSFKIIFTRFGGSVLPKIKKCIIGFGNPGYKKLDTANERSDTKESNDYTITGINVLKYIEQEKLYKQSQLLWLMVVNDKNLYHHIATYRPNKRSSEQQIESCAAYYLRRTKWIPNKDGIFCRPCDITSEELYNGFEYNSEAVFLKNLGFGDKTKAPDEITSILEKAGVTMSETDKELLTLPEDEKAEILRLLKDRRAERKRKSLAEALREENKVQSEYDEEDDYEGARGVKNPAGRMKKQQEEFEAGVNKKSEKKYILRYTYNTKPSLMEKQFIREQYKGKCQICGRDPIRKYNGDIYFEAINVISTANLENKLLNNIDTGWNTLCLCPTCAAEYRYCSKNLDSFEEQVERTVVEADKNDYIAIKIELKGKETVIHFTPRHFIALQAAFKVYKKQENK